MGKRKREREGKERKMSINCAGVVLFRRSQRGPEFLLLRSRWGDQCWSVPKGHVDEGETSFRAALRETEEETGISSSQISLVDGFDERVTYRMRKRTRKVPDGVKRVQLLLGQVERNTPVVLSNEHKEYRWVRVEGAVVLLRGEFREAMLQANRLARLEGLSLSVS